MKPINKLVIFFFLFGIIPSLYVSNQSISNPSEKTYIKGNDEEFIVTFENFPIEAEIAFQYAIDIWETLIQTSVPIIIKASWVDLGSGWLGKINPINVVKGSIIEAIEPNAYYQIPLAEKIAKRQLNNENDYDIEIQLNKVQDWYFGTDGATPVDKFDFVTYSLKIIGKALGFQSIMREIDGLGFWGYEDGLTLYYDHFVENGAGQQLIDTSLFDNGSVELLNQYESNNIYFDSPIARSVNSGLSPRLYAPAEFDPGSSISHLNETTYPSASQNALMTPFINRGEAVHNPGPISMAILAEIGWIHTYIEHDSLKDAEDRLTPFSVTATITSDTAILTESSFVYYSFNGFSTYDSLPLIGTLNPNEFTNDLPVTDTGITVCYNISTTDYFNRDYIKPVGAPNNYFQFHVGKDTIEPIIKHTAVNYIIIDTDTLTISGIITDNLGVDTVFIEYFINSINFQTVGMDRQGNCCFKGHLIFEEVSISVGDSLQYRIVAIDSSTGENTAHYPSVDYINLKIVEALGIEENLTNHIDVTCNGYNNGQFEVVGIGASGEYEFSINEGISWESSGLFTNLSAGIFNVLVRDAVNISYAYNEFTPIVITQPSQIDIWVFCESIPCYMDSISISVYVTGGTPPFTIYVDEIIYSEGIQMNLYSGFHTIRVVDANGCEDSQIIYLDQPDPLEVDLISIPLICYEDSTASISSNIWGGTPPYAYEWSNGSTTSSIINLWADTYRLVVTDANGCVISDSVEIVDPDPVITSDITGSKNVSESDIVIYAVNQTTGSTFEWTVTGGNIVSGQGTNSINAQWGSPGIGTVSVIETDENGCKGDTVSIEVNIGSTGVQSLSSQGLRIYPNPFTNKTIIEFPNSSMEKYQLIITDVSGKVIFIQDNIIGSKIELDRGNLSEGIYFIELKGEYIYRGKILIE